MNSDPHALTHLGWDDGYQRELDSAYPGLAPARIVAEHKQAYSVRTVHGELAGIVPGRLLYTSAPGDLPAVGDWVAAEELPLEAKAVIHGVLPRRTRLSRKVAGERLEEQVLAANVDFVFVVGALNEDFNLRRIERFLTPVWESGATPVVVLTKVDLCDDVAQALEATRAIAPGAQVVAVSAVTGEGLETVGALLDARSTIVLLGSSGVGKSTLINRLLGSDLMATKEIRDDGRGRHTTTHRQLIPLPDGGAIIDTPGLREFQLWDGDAGIDSSFSDIAELGQSCRFADCTHTHEPDCRVLAALAEGVLPVERLGSYRKQLRELAAVARKKDKRLAHEEARKWKRLNRDARARARLR